MENAKPKSRRLAGWLAIFLGSLGAHNFYLGNKKRGFLHIFLFCLILIPIIIFYHIIHPLDLGYDTTIYDSAAYVPDYSDLMTMISTLCILIFIANIIWGIFEGVLILLPKNSPTTAGVLGIFFGFLGVHDFYLGNNKKGYIHLFTFIISVFLIFIYSTFSEITDNPTLLKPLHYIAICFIVSDILWGVTEGFWLLNAKPKTKVSANTAKTNKIKLAQEKNHYWTILSLTFFTLIITFILKNFSLGLVTMFLFFIPVRPIASLVAGILFAKLKNKDAAGYILFALSCLTSILFALFFSDYDCIDYCRTGEDHTVALIRGGGGFSNLCFIVNILLSIAMFIYCGIKSHHRKHPKINSVSTSP